MLPALTLAAGFCFGLAAARYDPTTPEWGWFLFIGVLAMVAALVSWGIERT